MSAEISHLLQVICGEQMLMRAELQCAVAVSQVCELVHHLRPPSCQRHGHCWVHAAVPATCTV